MLYIKLIGITLGNSNMVANSSPTDLFPPRPLGLGKLVQIQLFQNIAKLYIKLKRICNAGTQ